MRQTYLQLAAVLIALSVSNPAGACSYPIPQPFDAHLRQASSVLIVRLESAQLKHTGVTGGLRSEWIEGKIRIVQTLKAPKRKMPPYSTITYSTRSCGGLRLDVGHYFLVATDDYGHNIKLGASDQSIIDVTDSYSESHHAQSAKTDLLRPVFEYLAGKPLPQNYPPPYAASYTSPDLPPPPPPAP